MKNRLPVPLILILTILVVRSRISPHFLDGNYLIESATLFAEIGLIAIAMNFVMTSGGI